MLIVDKKLKHKTCRSKVNEINTLHQNIWEKIIAKKLMHLGEGKMVLELLTTFIKVIMIMLISTKINLTLRSIMITNERVMNKKP